MNRKTKILGTLFILFTICVLGSCFLAIKVVTENCFDKILFFLILLELIISGFCHIKITKIIKESPDFQLSPLKKCVKLLRK